MRGILWGGLAAGVLDITGAIVTNGWRGVPPVRVLQSVASGLLGPRSFEGGAATAALGLALHFAIALAACAVFYAASRRLGFLTRRPWLWGPLYGIAVYFFMSLVVVPLSAAPFQIRMDPRGLATGLIVHMLCVGLPIALAVSAFSRGVGPGASLGVNRAA